MREDILRRLLVAKHLLAANSGRLTPNSDPAAVAQMVLVAHDAAELAIAALASQLNVPGLSDRIFLPDYAPKIESHTKMALPGSEYLRQLNSARVGFKHHGNLPDARDWYRVIDRTWDWVDQWCQAYLGLSIEAVNLEQLLTDTEVRKFYEAATQFRRDGQYKKALEAIGVGLFHVLRGFRGIFWPTVGAKNTEDALMLSAFGVRPSDFLALQGFLPHVTLDLETHTVKIKWEERETGHPGNWTDANVRFCSEAFLDVALKVQHAPDAPQALAFSWVFDDVITPRGDSATLFVYEFDGPVWLHKVKGRKTVGAIKKGQRLRCSVSPSEPEDKPINLDFPATLGSKPTLDTAEVLSVWIESEMSLPKFAYVERKEVDLGVAPKDADWVKAACPHLFAAEGFPQS